MWIRARAVFDGERLLEGYAVRIEAGRVAELAPSPNAAKDLGEGILAPGFVDLQVNGGGSVMFNDDPSVDTLWTMTEAHARLGTLSILPTLITDTPEKTRAAIEATMSAIAEGVPGIAGLHLEGPHLDAARAGAHDPSMIRPMEHDDLTALLEAAARLPVLLVTLAPASVSVEQVQTLASHGVVVSLGHSDADYDTCIAYIRAGAQMTTHLFNAMSPLGSRAPGLVGAALADCPYAGLIADGHHVHPASLRMAMASKPEGLFLVSDAMATTGSDITQFALGGRTILRSEGRLTLEDGTLAGADLHLARAVQVLIEQVGVDPDRALAMATSRPAKAIRSDGGVIAPGAPASLVHVAPDFSSAKPVIL